MRVRNWLGALAGSGLTLVPSVGCLTLGVGALAPALTPGIARAEEPAPDGKALFERAAAAVKGAQAITFTAEVAAEGLIAGAYPPSRVEVRAKRSEQGIAGWRLRVVGSMERDGTRTPLDIAWHAGHLTVLDQANQVVTRRPTARAGTGGGLAIAQRARMPEILNADPFRHELGVPEYTLEDPREVSGEMCDVVVVSGRGGRGQVRWAIARSDGFPRLWQQVASSSTSGAITVTFSRVTLDSASPPAMMDSDLEVPVPEGFRLDDPSAGAAPAGTATAEPVKPEAAAPSTGETRTPSETRPSEVQPPPAGDQPAGPRAQGGPQGGVPNFELSTPQGTKVRLSELRGSPVVIQFWGSWCLPCRDWHDALLGAVRAASADAPARVLAIAMRERNDQNAISEAGAREGMTLLLRGDEVADRYSITRHPTTIVLDAQGVQVLRLEGEVGDDAAARVTRALTGEPAPEAQVTSDQAPSSTTSGAG